MKLLCPHCHHTWVIRNKQVGRRQCPLCRGVVYLSEIPKPESKVVATTDTAYVQRHIVDLKQLDWADVVRDEEFDEWWQGTFRQEEMGIEPERTVEAYLKWRDKRRHIDD